jgi:hypothetical protein
VKKRKSSSEKLIIFKKSTESFVGSEEKYLLGEILLSRDEAPSKELEHYR